MVVNTNYRLMQVKNIAESAMLSTFIKLLFVTNIFVCFYSIFKWPLKTGLIVFLRSGAAYMYVVWLSAFFKHFFPRKIL